MALILLTTHKECCFFSFFFTLFYTCVNKTMNQIKHNLKLMNMELKKIIKINPCG